MSTQPGALTFNARYAGLGSLGLTGFFFVLAVYGVRGIFLTGRPWRWLLFGLFFLASFMGGFRSLVMLCAFTFIVQFFLEGLHRTPLMPAFVLTALLILALLVPFASHLPFTFQRSLAFLPLEIDRAARADADGSEDWRLEIWRDTYPKVPQYLLLGKGYAISADDQAIIQNHNFKYISTADLVSAAGDYHSGPLSILMPFGAWGAIAVLWFWYASVRALYCNFRYGDPAYKVINTFLFAAFMVKIFMFLVVFGSLEGQFCDFIALIGLGISINNGIRRPVPARTVVVDKRSTAPLARPRFQPFYQR